MEPKLTATADMVRQFHDFFVNRRAYTVQTMRPPPPGSAGKLEESLMPPPVPLAVKLWRRMGFAALTIGLLLVVLIIYAEVFA